MSVVGVRYKIEGTTMDARLFIYYFVFPKLKWKEYDQQHSTPLSDK